MSSVQPLNKVYALWIMITVLILDQFTKILVRANMDLHSSKPIIGDLLRLSYVENDGAAFSLSLPNPAYNRIFFISVSILALIFIIYLLYQATHRIQIVAFGLVLGGAIGNLIDRIRFGSVTDFIDADFPDFIMHRWPVFNIADSAIVIAMGLIIFDMFFIRDDTIVGDDGKSQDIQAENSQEMG